MDCPEPFRYSEHQLDEYFDHLGLKEWQHRRWIGVRDRNMLEFLNRLIRAQLRTIPFENLDLHFTHTKTINLEPERLFVKLVASKRHRGGYCLENNMFFGIVLRSLGFEVTHIGGRVNLASVSPEGRSSISQSPYRGWGHMCNIVVIDGRKYLVDVGFGNNAPVFAVPLKEHFSARNIGDASGGSMVLITRGHVSESQEPGHKSPLWLYSYKFADDKPWIPGYCFSEIEFLSADFEVMNFYTSQHPESWFRRNIVVSEVLFDDHDKPIGDLTCLNGRIKERIYGNSRLLCDTNDEVELLQALRIHFNITLRRTAK